MTLPQILLALDEQQRAEAGEALLHLNTTATAMLATAHAKHDPVPLKRLTHALEKMT